MAEETRKLVNFAANLRYEHIPPHVCALGVDLLVNTVGCAVGGSHLPWAKQVLEAYSQPGGQQEATVVRYGMRLPVTATTFINSTFAHGFEYDDGTPPYHGHPGSESIPAFMAIGELKHTSGKELLAAIVAAYEVRGRIGWAVSPTMSQHGAPHYSSACAPFAVAIGAGRLLGLDEEGLHAAIGISGSFSGGLMQYDQGGGEVKRMMCAIGASAGVQSALLAKAGMGGVEGILEGRRGLLRMYSRQFEPERLVAEFGKLWTIEKALFKAYSCCGIIHSAIDAMRNLVTKYRIKASDIASVEVGYPTGLHHHAAITRPRDIAGMQFSTSYTLALTVLKGSNTPQDYSMEAISDPVIQEFADRVRVVEDLQLTRSVEGTFPARVKVRLRSGQEWEDVVVEAKGSGSHPLTAAEIDEKFQSQVEPVLGPRRSRELLTSLRHVADLNDVAKLAPMLVQ